MLGVAFFGFSFLALCSVVSGYVPVVIGLLWVGKMCLIAGLDETLDKKEAAAPGRGTEIMHLRMQSYFEMYTPRSLAEGQPCKVVVRGVDNYLHHGNDYASLDAVYLMGDGQYARHQSLLLDGQPAVPCEEDPAAHCYAFLYTGTGRPLSILLRIPQGHRTGHGGPIADGPLHVNIHTLSDAEEMQVKAIEEERQREAIEMQHEALHRRALVLATAAHLGSNFLREDYQQNYARKFTSKVLDRLGAEWLAEYREVLSDAALSTIINVQHPHVMPFLEARLEVIRIAERIAAEPMPESRVPVPQSRLTPAEWAARIERYRQRSLTRKRVRFEDHKADVMQDLDMLQEFVDDLDRYPLDEDERERLIQEFKERLLGGEEEHSHSFKQL